MRFSPRRTSIPHQVDHDHGGLAILDLETQVLFVWEPDRAPILDGVVLEEWESAQFYVPGRPLHPRVRPPRRTAAPPHGGAILSDWAAREVVVRARVTRGRDRVRLGDGETEVTLYLRSAVLEAHPRVLTLCMFREPVG